MGKSKKSLPGGAGQRDLSINAIKRGYGLKTVVSDFLPEFQAQSVRFTLDRLSSKFKKLHVHTSKTTAGCAQKLPRVALEQKKTYVEKYVHSHVETLLRIYIFSIFLDSGTKNNVCRVYQDLS